MQNNNRAFLQPATKEPKIDLRYHLAVLRDHNNDHDITHILNKKLHSAIPTKGQYHEQRYKENTAIKGAPTIKKGGKATERSDTPVTAARMKDLPGMHKIYAGKTVKGSLQLDHPTTSHSSTHTKPSSRSLWNVSAYADDIYNYLHRLEFLHAIKKQHLNGQIEITPDHRATLIDWLIELTDLYQVTPEAAHLSVNIIDRFLQEVRTVKVKQLQLLGVGAFAIAMKYEQPRCVSMALLSYHTDNAFTAKQIVHAERIVLRVIDFRVSSPTPIEFLRRYSGIAKADCRTYNLAKFFIELATVEYELASCKPSVLAAAALYLSLQLLSGTTKLPGGRFNDALWSEKLQVCARVSALDDIACKMAYAVRNSAKCGWLAAYKKYQSIRYEQVSMCSELSGEWFSAVAERGYGPLVG